MRWWAAPATHAAFSSLCACLCCWLLVRVLPGLFGAGLRLCTTPARVRTLVIVSVCMAVGPLWLCSLGDSLRLWCWAGWSCRRKPHGKCLKWAQAMDFRALRAPWSKNNTTWPKMQLFHRKEDELFFPRSDRKTKCMGRSQPRGVMWASRSLKGCTQLRSRFFDVQSSGASSVSKPVSILEYTCGR